MNALTTSNPNLCDIYTLKTHRTFKHETDLCRNDLRNMLKAYTKGPHKTSNTPEFKIANKELICSQCSKETLFIYDSINGLLCPSCFHSTIKMKHGYECNMCYKQYGCITCGSDTDQMIDIDDQICCLRDRCLMPFGYYILNNKESCICEQIAFNRIRPKLPDDIANVVRAYLFMSYIIIESQSPKQLPDLSIMPNDTCFPCYKAKRYKDVTCIAEFGSGEDMICSC